MIMADSDPSCTLLVRHLPSDLDRAEKEDLLQHFGAQRVKVMGAKGPMKHTAFATFSDIDSAKEAMAVLHQMEILDCKLVVEFARKSERKHFPSILDDSLSKREKNREDQDSSQQLENQEENKMDETILRSLPSTDQTFTKWSIEYPRNPDLHYAYPPPTASIITNIAHSIAACPKLYVQVLHLMNKMNLPAPFGGMTAVPPIPAGHVTGPVEQSSEESEIESDGESHKHIFGEHHPKKRSSSSVLRRPIKVPKLLPEPEPWKTEKHGPIMSAQEVFEQPYGQQGPKRIQLKIPEAVALEKVPPVAVEDTTEVPQYVDTVVEETAANVSSGGFGKMQPAEKPKEEIVMTESSLPYTVDPTQFISKDVIRKGRVSENEMKNFSVFKRYDPGEPTTRLYIKNLAKSTTEQDLVNVYGPYVDWTSELEKNLFDIRLMKEGRMKGQAFVTLPTDDAASAARKNTNAYVMHGKPMVVQFARSAKAKD